MKNKGLLEELAMKAWQEKNAVRDGILIAQAKKAVHERLGNWLAQYTVKHSQWLPYVEIKLHGLIFHYSLLYFTEHQVEHLYLVKKKWFGLFGEEITKDIRNLADLGKVLKG